MSNIWNTYSVGNGSQAGEDDGPVSVGGETPACVSCKQRKLRCSRELPTCTHCVRLCKYGRLSNTTEKDTANERDMDCEVLHAYLALDESTVLLMRQEFVSYRYF
jgi:hypothetical protein